ncbi:tRNA:m4X modification enzyme [Polyrhizophydium stewartii]|uniref:tRNA:m(4)X modification enzyme TRM13 n=1 Tax=Polyrhizophydium stewartii TaxID=2732419 RepID=A0ABR4NF17_9FUNG
MNSETLAVPSVVPSVGLAKTPAKKGPRPRRGEVVEKPPPTPGRCHHWLAIKNRYCKLQTKAGKDYCGEHEVFDPAGGSERVQCPYSSKHFVAPYDLERHKRYCPNAPKPVLPCFSKGINSGPAHLGQLAQSAEDALAEDAAAAAGADAAMTDANAKANTNILLTLSRAELESVASAVEPLFRTLFAPCPIREEMLEHPSMRDRIVETLRGKHALQQASLLGHVDKHSLAAGPLCVAEFGCGKGELTRYLSALAPPDARFLLIDRKQVRLKIEKTFKAQADWQRLIIDIRDLRLARIPNMDRPLLAVSKHLCGVATDLTLRCLDTYESESQAQCPSPRVRGIVIALCCHQLCRFQDYVNPDFLARNGIDARMFRVMAAVSTWAVCGPPRQGRKDKPQPEPKPQAEGGCGIPESKCADEGSGADDDVDGNGGDDDDDDEMRDAPDHQRATIGGEHWTGMSFEQREQLGIMCKRILDLGRCEYVRSLGFECELVHFVDRGTSAENTALVAWRMPAQDSAAEHGSVGLE